jgi:hypothetical protein
MGLLLSACADLLSSTGQGSQTNPATTSFTSSSDASNQSITYSTRPQDVLVRTFYGGGLYGSLELAPDISVYGDGTYILGLDRQSKLGTDALQQLLHVLVDTYGLLNLKKQQFSDIQDQNATFLELALNGKHVEFEYGPFGTQSETAQDMDEYHRLGKALSAITEALKGPVRPYTGTAVALLARRNFSPDLSQQIPFWQLPDFTLEQAADFECGLLPQDQVSPNGETGCLKYVKPTHAILLTTAQIQTIKGQLGALQQATFVDQGLYYEITLRPLLPDELPQKTLAMFGSDQFSYSGVPLLIGVVPPVPTPTPSR